MKRFPGQVAEVRKAEEYGNESIRVLLADGTLKVRSWYETAYRTARVKEGLRDPAKWITYMISRGWAVPEEEEKEASPKFTPSQLRDIFESARQAGLGAGAVSQPQEMVVQEHANMHDDTSAIVKEWHVPDGPCGFAWIRIRPGNSSAALYAKQHLGATTGYYGGVEISVTGYGQSVARKEAYATAFAKVLCEHGITAFADSRLD